MEESVQTIAILAACVVYLARQTVESYKKMRSNGQVKDAEAQQLMRNRVEDLHRWHSPVSNSVTGQPRFPWYSETDVLQSELSSLRKEFKSTRDCLRKMRESIDRLIEKVGA